MEGNKPEEDLIIDFLSGEMDQNARNAFEQRLATEPELAARVALEQDIAEALNTSSPENQLRANLSQIANKYPTLETLNQGSEKPTLFQQYSWWILGVILLILSALVYWKLPLNEQNTPQPPNSQLPPSPANNTLPPTPEAEKNSTEKPTQPIAAAFKPIAKLESYIGSKRRSGDFEIVLKEPKSGASFLLATNQVQFRLSGQIIGSIPPDADLNLLIFSNKQKDFEALRDIEHQALNLNPKGEFKIQKQWKTSPGLYYIVIEDRQSGEWLLVDKFLVK